nr:metacaspase-1-like [Ipomoea batatas]
MQVMEFFLLNRKRWANNEPPSRTYKGTLGGKAICFGACEDHQMAADTSVFSSGKEMNGAMTYTFIRAIKENPNITYGGLLNYMHQSIVAANRGRCLPSLNLFNRKLEQDTVLSSSQDFDINQKLNLWAGLRWLGVAAMAGRGGAGEADVRSGEARWRCVGEARWTCGGGGASAGGCARVEVRPRVRRLLREGGVVRRRRTKKIGKKKRRSKNLLRACFIRNLWRRLLLQPTPLVFYII